MPAFQKSYNKKCYIFLYARTIKRSFLWNFLKNSYAQRATTQAITLSLANTAGLSGSTEAYRSRVAPFVASTAFWQTFCKISIEAWGKKWYNEGRQKFWSAESSTEHVVPNLYNCSFPPFLLKTEGDNSFRLIHLRLTFFSSSSEKNLLFFNELVYWMLILNFA